MEEDILGGDILGGSAPLPEPEQGGPKTAAPKKGLSDPGDLLSKTWEIFKKRIGVILLIVLAGLGMAGAVFGALFGARWYVYKYMAQYSKIADSALIGGAVIAVYIGFLMSLALVKSVTDREITVGGAYSFARQKVFHLAWIMILTMIIIYGLMIYLIIPAIIFSISFFFSVYILAGEGTGGMDALLKSRYYVKGRWWGVFLRLLLLGFVVLLMNIIPVIGALISLPYTLIFYAVLYEDLKETRGDTEFIPQAKTKAAFLIPALIGLLIVPAAMYFSGSSEMPKFSIPGISIPGKQKPLPPGFSAQFGSKGKEAGQLENPVAIELDPGGNIYVLDHAEKGGGSLNKFSADGEFIGSRDEASDPETSYLMSFDIAVDNTGNIFLAEAGFHRVQMLDPKGKHVRVIAGGGIKKEGTLNGPHGVAVGPDGVIYVADTFNKRIQKFDKKGNYLGKITEKLSGKSVFIRGITVDAKNNIYVSDEGNHRIIKFSSKGKFIREIKQGFSVPKGICTDENRSLYVADGTAVYKFTAQGMFVKKWQAADPDYDACSVAVGLKGNLFVLDRKNCRVLKTKI